MAVTAEPNPPARQFCDGPRPVPVQPVKILLITKSDFVRLLCIAHQAYSIGKSFDFRIQKKAVNYRETI